MLFFIAPIIIILVASILIDSQYAPITLHYITIITRERAFQHLHISIISIHVNSS